MSGGEEAGAAHAAAPSANGTPKLRLTFKLSEIRAATPTAVSSSPPETASSPSPAEALATAAATGPPRKRQRKNAATAVATSQSTPAAVFVPPHVPRKGRPRKDAKSAEAPSASSHPASTGDLSADGSIGGASAAGLSEPTARPIGSGNRTVFPEQVQFVCEMKKFRPRRWRLEPMAALTLATGRLLLLPAWVHEEKLTTTTAAHGASPGGSAGGLPATFVCTYEGCHKIFDLKDKWRRHQNAHRKKSRKASTLTERAPAGSLQLKLNMGMIKAAVASRASSKLPSSSSAAAEGEEERRDTDPPSVDTDADAEIEIDGDFPVVADSQ